jgi:hypothetical protein
MKSSALEIHCHHAAIWRAPSNAEAMQVVGRRRDAAILPAITAIDGNERVYRLPQSNN